MAAWLTLAAGAAPQWSHSFGAVVRSAAQRAASDGIMCLTGIMNVGAEFNVDAATVNRATVLRNLRRGPCPASPFVSRPLGAEVLVHDRRVDGRFG